MCALVTIVPTILEATGIPAPDTINGIKQRPIEGGSMVYTFDKPGLPLVGMLTYSALVTLYTAYVELAGGLTGVLLWPTVVLHVILTVLLIRCQWHVLGLRTPRG